MNKSPRIIYLGTPDFAVEALRRLVEAHYNVVAVVTMPDKPVGRHHNRLQASPVKEYALSQGLPVLQPERLKDEAFLAELKSYNADLQIVVAFRMLPEAVWAMPPLGTFNIHASLLPQYRGAAPINWAIINGDKETGLTAFFLQHDIDTGNIIDQVRVPISEDCTCGELHDTLMHLSGDLALRTVDSIANGTAKSIPQSEMLKMDLDLDPVRDRSMLNVLRPAPKIFKETCRIDWTQPLGQIYNFVRGLSPYPGAWTVMRSAAGEQELKIFGAEPVVADHSVEVGSLVSDGRKRLDVAVPGGWLRITELQLAGKKRMATTAFLCGQQLDGSERLL
ncbi:MAG: methionyl-tRNA formyltransferase [Bacteroidaceae bacterium]|nr:methionyl-tRNA formyltransferase [Bacteroidaceae bacterium]MBO4593978.1 methionyl-tRNA formyltransferase [Bacteroidaceae bacterium]MBR4783511.1 methionyl-tRNA formyltransferase [Bacteroidaceae bacterium]